MKKIIKTMMAVAIAAFTLTACEDVPAPYPQPDDNGNNVTPDDNVDLKGTGTLDDPFNAAAAINYIKSLGVGVESDKDIYIKGIVSSVKEEYSTNYGNGTFYISDDGTSSNQFYVFRALYLGNKKFSSGDTQIKDGDEVIVCGRVTLYNSTPETVQNKAFLYSLNGVTKGGGGGGGETGTPAGSGTQADPYNVAAVLSYINGLGADVTSPNEVYVKGKVTGVTEEYSTQFGNGTFTIADEGVDNKFTAYRVLYLGNEKYKSGQTQIKVGDEVIVCGKVVNYRGNTPETAQNTGYLYSLNGVTKSGNSGDTPQPSGEAKGDGTEANPFNSVAANAYASSLAAGVKSDKDVYIKGIVVSVKEQYGTQYGNATFYISDDGTATDQFYVFRALYLGNQKYTGGEQIQVGDEVVVCGKVVNYQGNTPETQQGEAYLVSLTHKGGGAQGGGQGGEETTDGYVITMSSFGLANQADATTLTAGDGTTLTFSQEGGKNMPKFYEAAGGSVRMYALNSLTITSKKTITKVIITTTEPYNGTAYNGNDTMYGEANGAKVSMSKDGDTQVTFSGFSSTSLKVVNDYSGNSGGTQLRVMKLTITYAE